MKLDISIENGYWAVFSIPFFPLNRRVCLLPLVSSGSYATLLLWKQVIPQSYIIEWGHAKELDQRIQVVEGVMDRRTRDCNTILGLDQAYRLVHLGRVVFDAVRFVEYHALPLDSNQWTV